MKLPEFISNVVVSNNIKVENFRIKINRQSFKLLYGDLYSYKIKAVIRELSTNAADSHFEAGKPDVPFEVHLPNDLEPYFSIKDCGVGMSPQKVRDVYTIVCESDKVHSNDYTGCLGLGSKSPFACTESFSVESIYNGKRYVYACFLNSEGEPCFAEVTSTETDEPNGVEIKFPVERNNFDQFADDAAEVYKWFKVKPIVSGRVGFEIKETNYLVKSEIYGVRKDSGYSSVSNVIMGNIAYPINLGSISWYQLDKVERDVIEWGVDLFVNMGDVEFVPSREHLSYSDKTITCIKNAVKETITAIRAELENQINTQTSIWKARCLLYKIRHSILGKVRPGATIKYNGKDIEDYISNNLQYDEDAAVKPSFQTISKKENRKGVEVFKCHSVSSIVACEETPVFLNDINFGYKNRIIHHLKTNGEESAYIISETGATPKFLETTGLGEVIVKVSTLPKPPPKPRMKSGTTGGSREKRTLVQEFTGGDYRSHNVDYWKDVEVDLEEGGVYVITSYGQILEDRGNKVAPYYFLSKFNGIKKINPDFKLYGIRPAHVGKLVKHADKWQKIEEYIEEFVEENSELVEKIAIADQFDSLPGDVKNLEIFGDMNLSNSLIQDFLKEYEESREANQDAKVKAIRSLIDHEEHPKASKKLVNLASKILKQYPLLKHIDWYDGGLSKPILEYIQLVDNQKIAMAV